MNWFVFCYWFEPDAPDDPVGLVRIWTLASALMKAGDHVTVFAPRYRSALVPRPFPVVPVRLFPRRFLRPFSYALSSFLHGLWQARRGKPDLLYYRWMESPHVVILARLLGARCVCEVNGEPVPNWSAAGIVRSLKHWAAQFALRRCDRVVVLTDGLKDLLVRRYAVPVSRIIVLPSGTDLHLFVPREPEACRAEGGLSSEHLHVGFVGSFYRYQGLETLVEAMVAIRRACPNARLLLVGDGEAAAELKEQAERAGLMDSIVWTGRVPYERVPRLIGAMTVCVAPFRADRGETSPVKLFDYLACARPVVASAVPSVAQIFASESGVRLVRPDDPLELAEAVIDLLQQPEKRAAMGEQGRRFVERQFGWDRIVERLRVWLRDSEGAPSHAHSHVL
jgi:glycosyltransferase involved in cell wall biosynthesis